MVVGMDISDVARQLVQQRKRGPAVCEQCGTTFTAYLGAKYCSAKCRVRAVRARKAASLRQSTPAS